jgi:hypothetical protein
MAVNNVEKSVSSAIRADGDLESQSASSQSEITVSPAPEHGNEDAGLEDNSNVSRLALSRLFWFFFYNFGLFAWGGPVAQIAFIKERLVIQDKWITLTRF